MNVTCPHCQHALNIPDEKVPDKAFAVGCPKCKKKITVDPAATKTPKPKPSEKPDPPPAPKPVESGQAGENDGDGTPKNPFQYLEEGVQTAIICEPNPDIRAGLITVVDALKYQHIEPSNPRDALRQMRFHDFDLIVLNELFGTRDPEMNHVLKYLRQLNTVVRRNMFIVLLTERYETNDNMMAFNKSVNLILNTKDIDHFDKVLKRGITDNDAFYKIFKEAWIRIKGF